MSLPARIINFLQTRLSHVLNVAVQINSVTPVSGGSINQAYCLHTNTGKLMLKLNSKSAYPDIFVCESVGLRTIGATNSIAVPQVIMQDDIDDNSLLILRWIESRRPTEKAFELLGRQLADMHRNSADNFGFDTNNYMGSLPQQNHKHATWCAFFIEERLQPMVKLAIDDNKLNSADIKDFENIYLKLNNLFAEELPSLIHGDLWGGNYLIGTNEKPYLIDPAVSYGNREFDIAMTTLFGGFDDRFYDAYNESFPLNKGWQHRLDLWNLYPLLLHLNLFGQGYLGQVRSALKGYL